jgi:Flp pilus assembly protein TadD
MGRLDEAVSDYSRALELDARNANAYHNRGSTLDKLGRLHDAISDFSRAIELDPGNASSLNSRGLARDRCGRVGVRVGWGW